MKNFNKNLIMAVFVLGFSFILPATLFASSGTPVNLGSAGNFVILSKTGISTTGSTSVVGNIGVSPISSSAITGFALTLPAASAFSTSALVTGKVYASDYAVPTPATMTTAVSDMQTAYTSAMGQAPSVTELGAGNISGRTLAPGVYKWGTGVTIPTDVTLSGSGNDVWIFQIAQTLTVSSGTHIILSGGAQASNIFWIVGGQTTIGTTAVFNGNILDQTAIVLNTGAKLNGRALAQTAVTLDSNSVVMPNFVASTPVVVTPTPTPTPTPNPTPIPANPSSGNIPVPISPTVNVAQNPIPVTLNISPVVTTMNTTPPGCAEGNKYNASTGQICVNNTFNFGVNNIGDGSNGDAVMELQRFLNAQSNSGLVVDGIVGPKTLTSINKWQTNSGLTADGIVGIKTKTKMNASIQ